ncbi:MAG: erythromycin esterase family protein [Gemmatimonadetes bacterium]|nr:erythromycin esterase family protein [Gemmatimonadota bacterium]
MRAIPRAVLVLAGVGCVLGCPDPAAEHAVQAVSPWAASLDEQLAPLGRAIGDSRIVLLGENGHGVGEFTTTKVRLIEWLHRELEFDLVVMESGFFECGNAWRRAAELDARELLYDCLKYPFQQAEIRSLFELILARRSSDRPLELAGMDLQPQGFDSGDRPAVLHATVASRDPALARRVAALDTVIFLVADSGGLGEDLDPWILEHGPAARAAYDSAAALTDGWERWAFRLAGGLVDRLSVRAKAVAARATDLPSPYYELRDEWMARAVAALADSIAGPRKVVVWLHNDHARLGPFEVGPHRVRSVGVFLREWYRDEVFSIGFSMGRGSIADNARREREVAAPIPGGIESFLAAGANAAGYLVLSGNRSAAVREWAGRSRPYLRMGLTPETMIPSEEFDALFYIHRVRPPSYTVPGSGSRSWPAPPFCSGSGVYVVVVLLP